MESTNTLLGRLEAAPVPWCISPSDTGLIVTCGEEQQTVVRLLASFLPDQHLETVRIDFDRGGWVFLSPHDGRDPLPQDRYDWSGVVGDQQPGELPHVWFDRIDRLWVEGGQHPLPGLYIVHDSAWAKGLNAVRRGLKHFVFTGHDVRLDILASDFHWTSEGEYTYPTDGELSSAE